MGLRDRAVQRQRVHPHPEGVERLAGFRQRRARRLKIEAGTIGLRDCCGGGFQLQRRAFGPAEHKAGDTERRIANEGADRLSEFTRLAADLVST